MHTKPAMKKVYILISAIVFSQFSFAQASITPEEAAKHVGETVTVCGKVFGGRFFETSKNSPTLLNMGAAYPASPFTVMIPGELRAKMGYAPEAELKEKNICVKGEIILYKEKPEIILKDVSDLEIKK